MTDETALSDRAALLEALSWLAAAIDAKDWTRIGAAFTDDARAYGVRGRAAIVARMRDHLGGCGPTQHLLGNHRVRVDGATARTLSYARVHHVGTGPKAGAFFECMGEYDDHWVRDRAGWLLADRTFDMQITIGDFGVLRPA